MNDTVSAPCAPEFDTRTINEVITRRIAELRERADEMESKLAAFPAEVLDTRIADLHAVDLYF